MRQIKLAIHHYNASFSERWIEYCEQKNIPYKLVDCTRTDIIDQMSDCDGLMWHWGHSDYKTKLFALPLTLSLEKMGKIVYPNSNSCWHFDDKVGQKYLFEAIGAPLVDSYIFYSKKEAVEWINKTSFPKVFKLRGGASSTNVSLVKNKSQAKRKISKAFKKGFPAFSTRALMVEKFRVFLMKKNYYHFKLFTKSIVRLFFVSKEQQLLAREKGYAYFQKFIPNNAYDTRVVVVGDRCFSARRYVRKNDFRASGSGISDHSSKLANTTFLKIAFDLSERLGVQSLALDFIYDKEQILLTEMSYAFQMRWYDKSEGYWDREFVWHGGPFKPQYWMVENLLEEIRNSQLEK